MPACGRIIAAERLVKVEEARGASLAERELRLRWTGVGACPYMSSGGAEF